MSENTEPKLKSPQKRTFRFTILMGAVLMFMGQIFGDIVKTVFEYFVPANDFLKTFDRYFEFWGIWFFVLGYMAVVSSNRPLIKEFWTGKKGNTVKNLVIGLLLGGGLNALCAAAAIYRGDVSVSFSEFNLPGLIAILFAVCVQSGAEELVCRGFMYERLKRERGPVFAVIANALFFGIIHLGNNGVTVLSIINIFAVGILMSFMVYFLDSFWMAVAFHTMWNYTQNIIFGLPNSGVMVPFSIMKIEGTPRNSFAYDTGFGLEGTVLADVVLVTACVVIFIIGKRKKHV